jgi:hypothetical protein
MSIDGLKTQKGCDVCGDHERAKEVQRGWLCKKCLKDYIKYLEKKEYDAIRKRP